METELLQQILGKLTSIEAKVDKLEVDVKELKQGQAKLEADVKELKQGQAKLEARFDKLEARVDRIVIQQKENTDFIKAIKHATEENNAKLEGISVTVAELEGASVKLDKIESNTAFTAKRLSSLETVTIDNSAEIVRLKIAL